MFPVRDVIPSRTTPFVTVGLIVLNALVFLYELRLDPEQMYRFAHDHGFIPAAFSWPTALTSLFIHDGWIHVGGNILFLWIFGDNVEDAMGHGTFLLFYVTAGAAAVLAHTAIHPSSAVPLIGASGSVAAVMGAYFVLYPRSQVLTAVFLLFYLDIIEIPAMFFLGTWLLLQLVSGLSTMGAEAAGVGTSFGAHIAGFATGVVAGFAFRGKVRAWD
jgi:membrane associated rhomboid family serine protease